MPTAQTYQLSLSYYCIQISIEYVAGLQHYVVHNTVEPRCRRQVKRHRGHCNVSYGMC